MIVRSEEPTWRSILIVRNVVHPSWSRRGLRAGLRVASDAAAGPRFRVPARARPQERRLAGQSPPPAPKAAPAAPPKPSPPPPAAPGHYGCQTTQLDRRGDQPGGAGPDHRAAAFGLAQEADTARRCFIHRALQGRVRAFAPRFQGGTRKARRRNYADLPSRNGQGSVAVSLVEPECLPGVGSFLDGALALGVVVNSQSLMALGGVVVVALNIGRLIAGMANLAGDSVSREPNSGSLVPDPAVDVRSISPRIGTR